jgi:hypothetical protein
MRCFCGCGMKVPIGLRSVNRRGKRITKDVEPIELFLSRGLQSPNAERFVAAGQEYQAEIAEAIHTRTMPDAGLEADTRDFMRWTRERFLPSRIGQAAKRAGLDSGQAAAAIASGRWDPFAD